MNAIILEVRFIDDKSDTWDMVVYPRHISTLEDYECETVEMTMSDGRAFIVMMSLKDLCTKLGIDYDNDDDDDDDEEDEPQPATPMTKEDFEKAMS